MSRSVATGGRPRRSGVVTDGPRDGILTAAAALFAQKGFKTTRVNEIAEAAGLQQSSIYYWFHSKDEILRAIMDQNRVSLTAARALSHREESAAVRLYVVLYQDVIQMCRAPLNFYDLEEAASNQPDVFSDFHEDYAELVDRLQKIVEDGIASGQFCALSPEEVVRNSLSLNEGSQYRFHMRGGNRTDAQGYADSAARTSVRALLKNVENLPDIQRAAREGIEGFRALAEGATVSPSVG